MTKDDYLRIARECGFEEISQDEWAGFSNTLESFASTIEALEREECAKVCEYRMPITDGQAAEFERSVNTFCAAAIRNKEK
jgi:hypothetical protein